MVVYSEKTGGPQGFSPIWPHRGSMDFDAGKVRVGRVLPFKCVVRIVPRWRADLRLAVESGEAVLILPGMEVSDAR